MARNAVDEAVAEDEAQKAAAITYYSSCIFKYIYSVICYDLDIFLVFFMFSKWCLNVNYVQTSIYVNQKAATISQRPTDYTTIRSQ